MRYWRNLKVIRNIFFVCLIKQNFFSWENLINWQKSNYTRPFFLCDQLHLSANSREVIFFFLSICCIFWNKEKEEIFLYLQRRRRNMEQVDGEYTFKKLHKVFFVIVLWFFLEIDVKLFPSQPIKKYIFGFI